MTVTIALKDGTSITIENFDHLFYHDFHKGEVTIKSDQIGKFTKKSRDEYTFVGKSTIKIKGSEIKYLAFEQ